MKKNILVQYQGGGYDGCIWEYNYFYIDKQGTFHNIASSGCGGIDNLQAAQDMLNSDRPVRYIYDLSNEQDIETFSRESHAVHVSGVLRWFDNYNSPDAEFFAVCSECNGHIDIDDAVVNGTEIFCHECFSIGECQCCESYVGGDNMIGVDSDEHYDFEYICTDCKEYHDDERGEVNLVDLRWQAFCTGTPDMFSGALREQRLQTNGGL